MALEVNVCLLNGISTLTSGDVPLSDICGTDASSGLECAFESVFAVMPSGIDLCGTSPQVRKEMY